MAGAKEISLDVAMTAFFSGLVGIFNLKEEQKVKTKDFSFWTILLLLSLYCLTNFVHWHQTNSTLKHDSH